MQVLNGCRCLKLMKVSLGYLLDFVRGSLGPSTVTLMALLYVATWKGVELMTIVSEKLFPATKTRLSGMRPRTFAWPVGD
jgi:hypothetical protein